MNVDIQKYIHIIVNYQGYFTYLIMFLIIFCEAGIIFMSFLPGDSLIFVIGTLAGSKVLNIFLVIITLLIAVLTGDIINYYIGKFFGKRILRKEKTRFFKKEYVEKAHDFYNKNGRIAIVMGRFIPVVRSFVAFVAGIGRMDFQRFIVYATIGSTLRVFMFLLSGYYFGTLEFVRNHFNITIVLVTFISMLPGIVGIIKKKVTS